MDGNIDLVNGAIGTAPNLVLYRVLVYSVVCAAVDLVTLEFNPCIQRLLRCMLATARWQALSLWL